MNPSYPLFATAAQRLAYAGNPHASGMKLRGLPGTLSPTYQDLQPRYTVFSAVALTNATQSDSASALASIVAWPRASSHARQSAIQSTWYSTITKKFVNAEVLPGPAM